MTLSEFIPRGGRAKFAELLGVGVGTLNNICAGRPPSPIVARRIEEMTWGHVTASSLRPDIFRVPDFGPMKNGDVD